jgi:hypothetical protein
VIDVLDGLRAMEGDPTVAIDDSGQRPEFFRPRTLYAWIETQELVGAEAGPGQQERFSVTLVYVAENEGEEAQQQRSSDVTDELSTKRDDYLAWIRAHEATPVWDHVAGDADMDFVRTFEGRAVAVRADGYRFVA